MRDFHEFAKKYFGELKKAIDRLALEKIGLVATVLWDAYEHERHIFIIGNGGSAATASHFACDLGKGTVQRLDDERERRFRVTALTDNVATMTAIGNDVAFEDIFYQQLRNLVRPHDVVIGISASGNSPNVVKAMQYAKKCGAITIGLLGFHTGGKLRAIMDYEITVQDDHYGRVEDIHLLLEHLITNYLHHCKRQTALTV